MQMYAKRDQTSKCMSHSIKALALNFGMLPGYLDTVIGMVQDKSVFFKVLYFQNIMTKTVGYP